MIAVHLKGAFAPTRHAAAYWRDQAKAGTPLDGARREHVVAVGYVRQRRARRTTARPRPASRRSRSSAASSSAATASCANAIAPVARTRMTENLGFGAAPDEATFDALDPANISPLVVWLGSNENEDVTGRVFLVDGDRVSVAEGWHRGPTATNDGMRWEPRSSRRSCPTSSRRPPNRPTCFQLTADRAGEKQHHADESRRRRCGRRSRVAARGRRRTRCSTRSVSARARPTRPVSSSSSPPRTRRTSKQRVLPTMPVVIAMGGGPGMPSWGDFDFRMLLHGEQGVTRASVRSRPTARSDSSASSSASTTRARPRSSGSRTTSTYVDSGKPAFTTRFAAFIRGEGGFGESRGPRHRGPAEDARPRRPTTR